MSHALFTAGNEHERRTESDPDAAAANPGSPVWRAGIPLVTPRRRPKAIPTWSLRRRIAAVVAITGVAAGGAVDLARGLRLGQDIGLVVANYFSLFTVVSSIATAVVLLLAARRSGPLARAGGVESLSLAVALATTSTAMIILAIVYNALLRGMPLNLATPDPWWAAVLDRWATESLHVIVPLYILADVLFAPRRRRLGWATLTAIVGIPLLWAAYTMLRGPFVPAPDGSASHWYPYPFLDPTGPAGYLTPLAYIGVIAVAFLALGSVLIALSRRRRATCLHTDRHLVPRRPLRGPARRTGSAARRR